MVSPSGGLRAPGAEILQGREVGGRWPTDDRGYQAFLDGGIEMSLARVNRADRGLDLLGAGVLGEITPRARLQCGDDGVLIGVGGQHQHPDGRESLT